MCAKPQMSRHFPAFSHYSRVFPCMDLIRLAKVFLGEVCIDEKPGLTQLLSQEDSEDEISKVHAETNMPVC